MNRISFFSALLTQKSDGNFSFLTTIRKIRSHLKCRNNADRNAVAEGYELFLTRKIVASNTFVCIDEH